MIERAGQGCAIETTLFERVSQPYVREGRRTGALRFGDPRAMALAGALCAMVHAVSGFTNKSLRSVFAGLLGADYTSAQMTYDLRRLRLHGLITRLPGTHTYVTTPQGMRVAAFYTKLATRVLGPLLAADRAPAPIEVRCALATLDRAVSDYVVNTRLGAAA
jgi:predicted MarR family transcription regulator